MSNFQEITIKPFQRYYWHSTKKISTNGQLIDVHSRPHRSTQAKLSMQAPNLINAKRRLSLSTAGHSSKHWILNNGLAGQMYGRITTVSFWSNGRWVAVGFTSGIVVIYSLHFGQSSLNGILRRYCLLNHDNEEEESNESDKHLDSIIHLHTWSPNIDLIDSNKMMLVVVGVYASGVVRTWCIRKACHEFLNLSTINCINMFPLEYWSKLHNDYRKFNNGENADELASNRHNEFTRESNVSSIISWSTCCTISQSSPGTCNGFVSATPLVWLTAGLDGYVYGRELNIEINDDKPSMTKRTDKFWRLDLAAHNPMSVTSADISPGGQYLITGSTDQTARIWHLFNGLLVFDTGKHPMCVRAVCFRPLVAEIKPNLDGEQIIATGDDGGTLRVWRLNNKMLQNQFDLCCALHGKLPPYSGRAVSPDAYQHYIDRLHSFNTPQRVPSPDARMPISKDPHPLVAKRPDFYSTAAGSGSTWLHKLVWSPDGNLLVGVSDRLCVWPFESVDSNLSNRPSHTNFEVYQCRVLRVFSSGIRDMIGSLPPLLVSPSHSNTISFSNSPCSSRSSSPTDSVCWTNSPIDKLPPTIVTVDSNTGTLYIFDPIGYLNCSSNMDL